MPEKQYESSRGHYILEWCPINSLELKPIPLTEEWLLKLGFKYNGWNYDFEAFKYHFQQCGPDATKDNIELSYKGNIISFTAIYVHQLQNIYFTLTGRELTINK